jgi:hypothetical protein
VRYRQIIAYRETYTVHTKEYRKKRGKQRDTGKKIQTERDRQRLKNRETDGQTENTDNGIQTDRYRQNYVDRGIKTEGCR